MRDKRKEKPMKKYRITKVGRIVALRNFEDVQKGDVGGLVTHDGNLSQSGNCWIYKDARVSEKARVGEDAKVYGRAHIYGKALVLGNARVCGEAQVCENCQVSGDVQIYGTAKVSGDVQIYGTAKVCAGTWTISPLQIGGTKYWLTTSGPDAITIGCSTYTIEYWLKNYNEIGKEEGFSRKEVREYGQHILYAVQWLKTQKLYKGR